MTVIYTVGFMGQLYKLKCRVRRPSDGAEGVISAFPIEDGLVKLLVLVDDTREPTQFDIGEWVPINPPV